MRERLDEWLGELARRAGVKDIPLAVAAGAAAIAVAIVVWAGWRWWPRDGSPLDTATGDVAVLGGDVTSPVQVAQSAGGQPSAGEGTATSGAGASLFVHVAGNVLHPGVYELAAGSRVVDAIDAAGGVVGDAVPDELNLARMVADGEQVFMPSEKDVSKPRGDAGRTVSEPGVRGGDALAQVDINSAEPAQLDALPGVGPSTAAKIVAERESNGPFASVDDLSRVSGIGPKKLEQLREFAYVR